MTKMSYKRLKYMLKSIFMIKKGLLCLFISGLFVIPASGSEETSAKLLSLDDVRSMAKENNRKLEIAHHHRLAASSMRDASFTYFLPGFDLTGGYIRTNKQFQLFDDDMLLPVVPYTAIDPQTGQVDPGRLLDPNFPHPDNTGVVFHPITSEPVFGPDGNPVFYSYSWLPEDEMKFGQKNNYMLNFGMTQTIYSGGKTRTQYKIAQQIEDISKHNEELELSELMYEVEKYYWKAYTLQEKYELAQTYYNLLEKTVKDMENLYREDIISQNKLLKVRIKLNEAAMDKRRAANGLSLTKQMLCQLIGLPINEEIELYDDIWISDEVLSLDELFHSALDNRPELKIASKSVELGESAVKLAESRFLPDIALSANYYFANPSPYHGFSDQFGSDWNVGVVMRVPIFHWNERRHVLSSAKHEKKVQQLKLEDYRELIQIEVNKIFYSISEARDKLNIAELSLSQAKNNLDLAQNNFDVGKITSTELMEAQTLWREAHSTHIEAKSELKLKQTQMQKAIGELIND